MNYDSLGGQKFIWLLIVHLVFTSSFCDIKHQKVDIQLTTVLPKSTYTVAKKPSKLERKDLETRKNVMLESYTTRSTMNFMQSISIRS